MKSLNSKLLKKFLFQAGLLLDGDWILFGGTLLPAVGLDIRSTVDIDIVSLEKESSQDQTLKLMDIAEELGLGVESINHTAAYFFKKVGYKKEDLILLHRGRGARIFRPSIALYWKLKVGRLTESDLSDCQHYYNFCLSQKDKVQKSHLRKLLGALEGHVITLEKKNRLEILMDLVSGS